MVFVPTFTFYCNIFPCFLFLFLFLSFVFNPIVSFGSLTLINLHDYQFIDVISTFYFFSFK